ncbi:MULTISPECIES: DUF6745 domain-containing protein [Streptomyces]|uniref:DUF6745 domain-containing protein n=1 Tax=Streptomyces TaxID=1883 RepID=UPI00140C30B1|nr:MULTISPECIES: hypothetical protein [Streptomyces]MDH6228143.1 hypothetical protein [Streptomyces sp. MJP52]
MTRTTDTVAGAAVPAGRVADWRGVAAATGPADRAAAEEGLRLAYRRAGLAEPERILWAGSPRGAVALLLEAEGLGRSVREPVRTAPWAAERERVAREAGAAGWSAHWAATGGRLWETARLLTERITGAVVDELAGDVAASRTRVRLLLLDAVLGQHDAAWLAAFDTDRAPLDGLAAVARHAGWWWPYERTAVLCERPVELHRDENGRLDRGDGPALAYPDGFALYAWRGMPVPAEFLTGLASLTPDRIRSEENAELRRVMLEHYGYDRYLSDSGARPLHRDGSGVLWRIDLPDDEPVVMVEVVNSTAEPDGTFRTYWLRVPPRTRTAREGVAWTFGLTAEAYAPVRET